MKFLAEVMEELGGNQLIRVLDFVRNLKDTNNEEKLNWIIETKKDGSYRDIFQQLGTLDPIINKKKAKKKTEDKNKKLNRIQGGKEGFVKTEMVELNVKVENETKENQSEEIEKSKLNFYNSDFDHKIDTTTQMYFNEEYTSDCFEHEMDDDKPEISEQIKEHNKSRYKQNKYENKSNETDIEKVKEGDNNTELYNESTHKKDPNQKSETFKSVDPDLETKPKEEKQTKKRNRKVMSTEADKTCQVCGAMFNKTSRVKMHMTSHLNVSSYYNVMDKVIISVNGEKFNCKDCSKEFVRMKNIKQHILQVHIGLYKKMKVDANSILEALSEDSELQAKLVQNPPKITQFTYRCCEAKFVKQIQYKHHMLTHQGQKPFSCPYCGQVIHTILPPATYYSCSSCSSSSSSCFMAFVFFVIVNVDLNSQYVFLPLDKNHDPNNYMSYIYWTYLSLQIKFYNTIISIKCIIKLLI